jgi:MFS family permease
LISTFMVVVESTIVATAMPTIIADLGGFRLLSLVFAAYLLTQAVSVPVYGRLADIYGRKRVFFIGAGVFLAGTTLCGFAASMPALILFRAIQGVGRRCGAADRSDDPWRHLRPGRAGTGAGLFLDRVRRVGSRGTDAGRLYRRARALGTGVLGQPAGRAAALVMFALFLDERLQPHRRRIDWLGAVLLTLGALMLALVQARRLGLDALGLAAGGAVALLLLAAHEAYTPEPLVPYRLGRNRIIALGNLGMLGTGAAMMGVAAFLPAYVQGVIGQNPTVAGFALGCQSVSWTFGTLQRHGSWSEPPIAPLRSSAVSG